MTHDDDGWQLLLERCYDDLASDLRKSMLLPARRMEIALKDDDIGKTASQVMQLCIGNQPEKDCDAIYGRLLQIMAYAAYGVNCRELANTLMDQLVYLYVDGEGRDVLLAERIERESKEFAALDAVGM